MSTKSAPNQNTLAQDNTEVTFSELEPSAAEDRYGANEEGMTSGGSIAAENFLGIEGLDFSLDSKSGPFDAGIILVIVFLGALYGLTRIAERIVKLKKDIDKND